MFKSSLLRKIVMALSGLFLISFLSLHFAINLASVFSEEIYNQWSHFMGYNGLVQFVLQPILIAGVQESLHHFPVCVSSLETASHTCRPLT